MGHQIAEALGCRMMNVITLELFFCVALRQLPIFAQAGLGVTLWVAQAGLELNYVAQDHLDAPQCPHFLQCLSSKDWDY